VATSASFPPIVGPVTYQAKDDKTMTQAPYNHVGDGGLFDNLGTESLTQMFLQKIPQNSPRKGLIIVIDTSFPFDVHDAKLDTTQKGFKVFADDPSRVVGIMEERANAYQMLLWEILRSDNLLLPDFDHLRIVLLKHTDAAWTGYRDLPPECADTFAQGLPDQTIKDLLKQTVSQIPTLFTIKNDCHGALLIKAAQKVVEQNRDRIVNFFQGQP
ncbi:MAG TPA: hypothetical protein VFL31_00700, partial [Nitrospiraceae bacterium]|nr:hypothetical protein [Nitrospiraceae bacterium]